MSEGAMAQAMAQKQFGVLLNEDLAKVLEFYQRQTGATFKSIVAAALFQWLFHDYFRYPYMPEMGPPKLQPFPLWMQLATEVAKGELRFEDVPGAILLKIADGGDQCAREENRPDRKEWYQERSRLAREMLSTLSRLIETDGTYEGVIAQMTWGPPPFAKHSALPYWSDYRFRLPTLAEDHPEAGAERE